MTVDVDAPPPGSAPLPPERRVISILAVDVADSTRHIAACDPEDAQIFFDRCFDHLRTEIERAGGTLVSYEGDGGIAAFGWPNPLEDHADRACAAAWEIQHGRNLGTGPGGRPVRLRIGVHTGLVALRTLRGGGQSRLDTVGAAVHLAAKLQQCARPGSVLVSNVAASLCRTRLELVPSRGSPALKTAGISAFELAGPPQTTTANLEDRYPLPMLGREAELAAVTAFLPGSGSGGCVALIGEPGVGKSRLAAAAVGSVSRGDVGVLTFFGDARTRTTPFAAARALIETALHSGDAALRRHLGAAGFEDEEVAAIEALLGASQGAKPAERARLTDTQLAQLLTRAFHALAVTGPVLVLIEDLHLIDPESRRFLRFLAQADPPHPFGLVLTGRPESLEDARDIARLVIPIEPLPRATMLAFAKLLWPNAARPPVHLLTRLIERAEGVPLILEELVRALDREGIAPAALPQTIESIVHFRLTHLSPRAKRLAQALSLLGENIERSFVAQMLGIAAGTIHDDLTELERFAFVHPATGNLTRMRHQMIAEACSNTLPRARRRELHQAAYATMASRLSGFAGHHEELAFHAEGAGELALALDHLWNAGLEARRASAIRSLSLIFDRAIGLITAIGSASDERYVDFVLMAFAAVLQLGEFEKMNAHLPRVIALARSSGRPERISGVLSQLGMICWFEGRYEEGLRATEEGLAIARTLNSPALFFSNMIMQTNILHCLGQVRRAIEEERELCALLTGELESARLGAAGIPSAIAHAFMSWFLIEVGEYEEGLACAEHGLAIALRERDAYAEVLARHALGRNLIALHRNEEAVACFAVARESAERNGYDAIKADMAGRVAIALARTGRAAEAVALVEECMRAGLHLRTGQLEVYYLYAGKAEALCRSGDVTQGLAALEEALGVARRVRSPCLTVDGLGLRARMLGEFLPGDPRIAADLAEQAGICVQFGLTAWIHRSGQDRLS